VRWLILVAACTPSVDPIPIAPTPSFDGSLPQAILVDAGDDGGTVAPTGLYDFKLDVLSDTCAAPRASTTASQPLLVVTKRANGRTILNLPFPNGAAIARSDIEVGRPIHIETPCKSAYDAEIVEMSHDVIKVRRRETFTASCPEGTCKRDLGMTWTLRKSLCECNASAIRPLPEGGLDVKCDCAGP